jgi:hypothetical protein
MMMMTTEGRREGGERDLSKDLVSLSQSLQTVMLIEPILHLTMSHEPWHRQRDRERGRERETQIRVGETRERRAIRTEERQGGGEGRSKGTEGWGG